VDRAGPAVNGNWTADARQRAIDIGDSRRSSGWIADGGIGIALTACAHRLDAV